MKYCVKFSKDIKTSILNEVDEITILYDRTDLTLIDFLEKHQHQRVNIFICELENCIKYKDIEKLNQIKKEKPHFNFVLKFIDINEDIQKKLEEYKECKYFYDIIATDWDTFLGLVNEGVSDIYIGEDLGFELDKVSKIAKEHNINLRTFPNVSQNAWRNNLYPLKTFFIRPEDVPLYEQYIDVFEFFGGTGNFQDIYYDIYKNKKTWYGQLKEIIFGLDIDIDNKFIIPRFGEKRISCNRECLKGGKCNRCNVIEELSYNLEKSNLIVKIDGGKE